MLALRQEAIVAKMILQVPVSQDLIERCLKMMKPADLEFKIIAAVGTELTLLCKERGVTLGMEEIRHAWMNDIRVVKDDELLTWCVWADICKCAGVGNPSTEGTHLRSMKRPIAHVRNRKGRKEVRMLRPLDAAEWLEHRTVKQDLAAATINKLHTIAEMDGQPR